MLGIVVSASVGLRVLQSMMSLKLYSTLCIPPCWCFPYVVTFQNCHCCLCCVQTISAALQASQQAASAAVSRAALRQRQQEQLAALLGSERVLSGASARRLALGGTHQEQVRGSCLLLLSHCV
jgi:hypothetical protein